MPISRAEREIIDDIKNEVYKLLFLTLDQQIAPVSGDYLFDGDFASYVATRAEQLVEKMLVERLED